MTRPPATSEQRLRAAHVKTILLRAREDSGVTPDLLAQRAGQNRRTIDKYFESDAPNPSFFLVVDVAKALRVSLESVARRPRRRG